MMLMQEDQVIPKGTAEFLEEYARPITSTWFDFSPEYGETVARSLEYEQNRNNLHWKPSWKK